MNDYTLHRQILSAESRSLREPYAAEYCEDCRREVEDCKCDVCICGMKIESLDPDQECDCEESDKRRAKRLSHCAIEPCKRDKEDA